MKDAITDVFPCVLSAARYRTFHNEISGQEMMIMLLTPTRAAGAACLLALACFSLSGCGGKDVRKDQLGMANPASVFCKEQGGKLEIKHEKDGEVGYCHLPYGRVVEEWVLWRAAHHDVASH